MCKFVAVILSAVAVVGTVPARSDTAPDPLFLACKAMSRIEGRDMAVLDTTIKVELARKRIEWGGRSFPVTMADAQSIASEEDHFDAAGAKLGHVSFRIDRLRGSGALINTRVDGQITNTVLFSGCSGPRF